MIIEIWLSDKTPLPDANSLKEFLQMTANRRMVGHLRYERGQKCKPMNWISRLLACLGAYRKDGNGEHLLDLAVYAYREFINPQHPKYHFDPSAESVTRGRSSRREDREVGR